MKLRYFLLLLFFVPSSIFAFEDVDLSFEILGVEDLDDFYEVSYVLDYRGNLSDGDFLRGILIYDNLKSVICQKSISLDDSLLFEKGSCQFEKLGVGDYDLIFELSRDENLLLEKKIEYQAEEVVFGSEFGSYGFYNRGESLDVILDVEVQGENLKILSVIPKEALELVTEENKYDVISSQIDFEIVEEDPIIAWNVERAPVTINYTINKKVDSNTYENFSTQIEENKVFGFVKLFVGVLFVLILILIFFPGIYKKKK